MSLNWHRGGFLSFQIKGFSSLDATMGCVMLQRILTSRDFTSGQICLAQEPLEKSILTDSMLLATHSTVSVQVSASFHLFSIYFLLYSWHIFVFKWQDKISAPALQPLKKILKPKHRTKLNKTSL